MRRDTLPYIGLALTLVIVAAAALLLAPAAGQGADVELYRTDGDPAYPQLQREARVNVSYAFGIEYTALPRDGVLVIEHGPHARLAWWDGAGYVAYGGGVPLDRQGGKVWLLITFDAVGPHRTQAWVMA